MINAVGYAAKHSFSRLTRFEFQRDEAKDEEIEAMFRGVCHSDIHHVENEWSNTVYPCLSGHQGVGRVTHAGSAVTRHEVGPMVRKAMAPDGGNMYGKDNAFGGSSNVLDLLRVGEVADQRFLDFCAMHPIGPDMQVIRIDQINDACDKVEKGDVRLRDAIERASLKPGLES